MCLEGQEPNSGGASGKETQCALPKEGAPERRTTACVGVTVCEQAFQTEAWGKGGSGVFEAGGKPGGRWVTLVTAG